MCSPLKLIWKPLRAASSISVSIRRPDLCPVSLVVEGLIRETASLPYSMSKATKDESTWELIQGWGILAHLSSPCCSRFSANLLYRRDLASNRGSALGYSLGGVRVWKLSRTHPDEKPPPFTLPTHRCHLIMRKPTWHLLVVTDILVRVRAPYEGGWSTQFHLPRNMVPSLT